MVHPLVPGADPAGRQPIGLGVRVPMIIVSPWTTGGWVCSQTFDHTSVLQFLEARFGVAEPNISAWRRSICGDLTSAIDFTRTPDDTAVDLQLPPSHQAHSPIVVPMNASMPQQEPGLRPARPIPYQWTINPRLDAAAGMLWLDLANRGGAGAAFYIYDNTASAENPRRYTVAAGDTVTDCWPLRTTPTAYDAVLYGPNGYLCQARGEAAEVAGTRPGVEVRLHYDPDRLQILLQLENTGALRCGVEVRDAYAASQPSRYALVSGGTAQSVWDVSGSRGWYDLSVTVDGS
jgi:phospholipase C